ncbi:PTS transporter subunit EIIB [Gleimia sp. 6138-11-ORH1]|uniref:PTS transporter subunit EIIB n=1 Tax=Gleimia sp. 6138-11-ORH1 TaxID=2973937 RepID=UPI002166F431|nr:PTS transporter subunit EIIB [Gleimia sp. 6138-11-ORH1]MCS4484805.1 PTS transporter subunit EIIB [Gleimia sp. 6138-11-ORH1]
MNETERIAQLIAALGGTDNILAVEPCITRLRFEVADATEVDATKLHQPLCHGATVLGCAVQVIVGPEAENLLAEVIDQLKEE